MSRRLFVYSLLFACTHAAACVTDIPDAPDHLADDAIAEEEVDAERDPSTGDDLAVMASSAWSPFGFARVAPSGAIVAQFNSESTASASVTHTATGAYGITFPELGSTTFDAGSGGNVQLVSEGFTNFRCRIMGWYGNPNLTINVRCARPDGTPADERFAVMFTRKTMASPPPPVFPRGPQADNAYAWVTAHGAILNFYSYNSGGDANWATKLGTGGYRVVFPGMWTGSSGNTYPNTSLVLSTYGGADPGAMCTIDWFGLMYQPPHAALGVGADIFCYDRLGAPADTAFTIAASTSGVPWGQQSAHAWLYQPAGTAISSHYVDTWGRNGRCSAGSVTATFANPHVRVTVAGDLGPFWSSEPPAQRLSFASAYRFWGPEPMYCKVESVTSAGAPPSSTSVTTIHCYDEAGVTTTPELLFAHVLDHVGLPYTGCD